MKKSTVTDSEGISVCRVARPEHKTDEVCPFYVRVEPLYTPKFVRFMFGSNHSSYTPRCKPAESVTVDFFIGDPTISDYQQFSETSRLFSILQFQILDIKRIRMIPLLQCFYKEQLQQP